MNRPRQSLAATLALAALIVGPPPTTAATDDPLPGLGIAAHLPADPLIAWAADIGNAAEQYDAVLVTVRRFLPEEETKELDKRLADLDSKLGVSLREDLLAGLGPQAAVAVDLPPIDTAVGLIMAGAEDGPAQVLANVGAWADVRDSPRVERALRALFRTLGFEISDAEGVVRLHYPLKAPETEGAQGKRQPRLDLYYTIDREVLAFGFNSEQVRSMTRVLPVAQRLTAGADFRTVLSHLDPSPRSILYVNLPRLQEMMRSSQMVQGALAANPEAAPARSLLLDPSLAASGFGVTKTDVASGVRQVSFGPRWMSGGAATAGIVAAIAIPNLINAINRGRAKRTMTDLRTVGTAIEMYRIDHERLPPPSDSMVEVSALSSALVPAYIKSLPTEDAWKHPLMYWSDGKHYRLISQGRDGAAARDWSATVEGTATDPAADDIVYVDGEFLSAPEPVHRGAKTTRPERK